MVDDPKLYEDQGAEGPPDPEETPAAERKLITQPYDLGIHALMEQINRGVLHLRPISDRPRFQRRYVWPDKLASRLIESILMNVPIPPCYLAQDESFELDVIDGQQRIYSIYRFMQNQLTLSTLEVLTELNGLQFFKLPKTLQRKIETHTLRCVIVTNDSDPEIRFDVFERLNTNTVPLNAQELRNSIYRGPLNDLLVELAEYEPWLTILNRKTPDKRMRGEELILRFVAFYSRGVGRYRTPQKHWLNDVAQEGRKLPKERIAELATAWKSSIDKSLLVFSPQECFRRISATSRQRVINRALMDLTLLTVARENEAVLRNRAGDLRKQLVSLLNDSEFDDLITRAIDHKSRTRRRFEIWRNRIEAILH